MKLRLERAEILAKVAYATTYFTDINPNVAGNLKKAVDGIGQVRGAVASTKSLCQDVDAAAKIKSSIDILNEWVRVPPAKTNAEAAAAFDQLFDGIGRFAARLPVPFNGYAKIFTQIGLTRFFGNMQQLMDVQGSTPRGRQMNEVMEELDRQGRGH